MRPAVLRRARRCSVWSAAISDEPATYEGREIEVLLITFSSPAETADISNPFRRRKKPQFQPAQNEGIRCWAQGMLSRRPALPSSSAERLAIRRSTAAAKSGCKSLRGKSGHHGAA
jgi:hypothetical protein